MAMPAQALAIAPVPPQNLDAEESVLGAMMLSPLAIGAVTESTNLSAADFYRESHGLIYRSIIALYAKGEPVDAITVVDDLDRTGHLTQIGGAERVHELAALVPAASNAAHYARIVSEMATLRGLIRAGNDIARLGFDRPGETIELVDRAEQIVFDLSQQRVSSEFAHIDELLKESFETITKLYEAGTDVTGTPSGFRDVDRLTSGFQPGNLVIVAARPSMGKSALALCMAANVAVRHDKPVALFTLEMSKAEVTQRLMCSEGKVESQRLRTGKLAVDDWPRLTSALRQARQGTDLRRRHGLDHDDGDPLEAAVSSRCASERPRARDRRLPAVMTAARRSRTVYRCIAIYVRSGAGARPRRPRSSPCRDCRVPSLSNADKRRSCRICENRARSGGCHDLVMFVYRDEYYNPEETDSSRRCRG
jgi:replicative DNA helicase